MKYTRDSIMTSQQRSQATKPQATILVVDDEPSIITLCQAILEEAGFIVLGAEGSSDALKLLTHL